MRALRSVPPGRRRVPCGLRGLPALLGVLAVACGKPAPERTWHALSAGFVPSPEGAPRDAAGVHVRPAEAPGAFWVETTLPPGAWTKTTIRPGLWLAERPLRGGFDHFDAERVALTHEGVPYRIVEPPRPKNPVELQPGDVYLTPEYLHLLLAEGDEPPEDVRYATHVDAGRSVEGRWTPDIGPFSGAGIWVWPGGEESLELPAGGRATLRFTTLIRPFATDGEQGAEAVFRLARDGEPWFETRQEVLARPRFHELEVEARERPVRLTFAVEGPPGLAAFFEPVLGPPDVGRPGARPWKDARPNIVVFLADTLRADTLSIYGGTHGRAPALDALAERSLVFSRAWSTAAWTLPAQVSLLTGLFPGEHGATKKGRALPGDLVTLAETLRAHGYRTGAVTDSGFISRNFGLDAGFDWFEETVVDDWDLTQTLDSAVDFLERDDGRPAFLYVQTYRTHSPYRRGVEEDVEPWHVLMERVKLALEDPSRPTNADVRALFADEFRELYLDGVEGLDRELGGWLRDLEERRLLAPGFLIFTSDHGEAFGEHGDMVHGGRLWEEKVRVPLLLFGTGIAPGVSDDAASLVDLATTVAALAGVPPDPSWHGRALHGLDRDRPVFVFGEEIEELGSRLAVIEGPHKVMGPADVDRLLEEGVHRAYDLGVDPGEEHDLAPSGVAWPGELCRELAPVLRSLQESRGAPSEGELTPAMARDLQNIGYH